MCVGICLSHDWWWGGKEFHDRVDHFEPSITGVLANVVPRPV